MNKSFKEIYEDRNSGRKWMKEFKTTNWNTKQKTNNNKQAKKPNGNLEKKDLEIWSGTMEAIFTNRVQGMKKQVSGIEDPIDKMITLVTEDVKPKEPWLETSRKSRTLWKTKSKNYRNRRKRRNPSKIPENIFNKIIEENLLNLKKEKTIKVQEAMQNSKWTEPENK